MKLTRRRVRGNWMKASCSARAVGAYAVAVAGDAAYGEEAQGHFESVDPLLLGDGGDGDDDDGVGKAVVTSMVDRGIRELSDAVGIDVHEGVARARRDVAASAAPVLQVLEVLIAYLQHLASYLTVPSFPVAWKLGMGWIAAFKADVSAVGIDPDDEIARTAFTVATLAAPFAVAEWIRRVLRRHGEGKSVSEQEGFCESIRRWETSRLSEKGWRAFLRASLVAWWGAVPAR